MNDNDIEDPQFDDLDEKDYSEYEEKFTGGFQKFGKKSNKVKFKSDSLKEVEKKKIKPRQQFAPEEERV